MSKRRDKRQRTPDGILSQVWVSCRICDTNATETDGEWSCPTHGPLNMTMADMLAELQEHTDRPGRWGKIRRYPRTSH